MVLVCQVILRGHLIKGSCDIIGKNKSREVIILPSSRDVMIVEM